MLTITAQARDVIRRIPDQPSLPPTAGLRIAMGGRDHDRLRVRAVPAPRKGDRVFDYQGARVYVGPKAVGSLEDRTLDVRTAHDGRLEFLSERQA